MVVRRIKKIGENRALPIVTGLLFIILMTLAVYRLFYQAQTIVDSIIVEHVEQLVGIFKKINDTCVITGIANEVNYIDFLNVKSFVGSEVGALNLAYPKQWQGPYLHDNPTMYQKVYQIVKTKNGYYIVPGAGVKLTSGKVMGKDIIITPETEIEPLIQNGPLRYEGKALAARLPMGKERVFLKPEIFETVDA